MEQPVAILGVTGFIGRHLAARLAERGVPVTGVSRRQGAEAEGVARWQTLESLDLSGHRAVVNLSGERVDVRWTADKKKAIEDSRIGVTRRVVDHLAALYPAGRPQVLVNASGIGFYGDGGEALLDELAAAGDDYLAKVCVGWEREAAEAEGLGVRVVTLRTGVVLGKGGAAWDKLRHLFSLGIAGRLGSGKQWMPWIHVVDEVAAILHALDQPALSGPVNLCAPHPERNVDFTRKLAEALHRPAKLAVPGFALKLALGGFAGALLGGQRGVPAVLKRTGFTFRFPTLEMALQALVEEKTPAAH